MVAISVLSGLLAPGASAALISSTWLRGDGKTVVQFTAGSDTWTVPAGVTDLELLVVGGGGSSANPDNFSSGAGAGGYYFTSSYAVTPGAGLTLTVADGGVGASGTGGSSIFGQVIAYGGQGGGSYNNGGNQGGYSLDNGFTIVPGNAGGKSAFNGNFASGGGAGAVGVVGNGQAGGIGLSNSITGTLSYYAGGGGATNGGAGGLGGGGAAGNSSAGVAGTPNTGGGGGGGHFGLGGTGGSGVVTVAYVTAVPEPSTVALAFCGALFGMAVIRNRRKS